MCNRARLSVGHTSWKNLAKRTQLTKQKAADMAADNTLASEKQKSSTPDVRHMLWKDWETQGRKTAWKSFHSLLAHCCFLTFSS